jgi:hypothetical protein
MLNREYAPFLGLVKLSEKHLRAAYMMPRWIEMWILQDVGNQGANARVLSQ